MAKKTIQELRAALKPLGYKIKTKTYSAFIGAEITKDGMNINPGCFRSQDDAAAWRATHAAALAIIESFKGQTFDGDFRVVLTGY